MYKIITIEGRQYPGIIMGEDKFTGWFERDFFKNEASRATEYGKALNTAYEHGVRGFSMSPHRTLVKTLMNFKTEKPEIGCIANPHWQSHYYVNDESLWTNKNRSKLASTVYSNVFPREKNTDIHDMFSCKDIRNIRLDEHEYKTQLHKFSKFCDFSIVGNLGMSALILLERDDIIIREIEIARQFGLIPIGICECGGLALSEFDKLDLEIIWIRFNRFSVLSNPDISTLMDGIKNTKKTMTAYRIFENPDNQFDLERSINFIQGIDTIKSIVVGIDNACQAGITFSKLQKMVH